MSSPRATETFCYVIHSVNQVTKRRTQSLDKDLEMESKRVCLKSGLKLSFTFKSSVYIHCIFSDAKRIVISTGTTVSERGWVLHMMAYTGRLRSPERDTFFRLQVYERVGISLV